jgi:type IV pilus assembly protein PilW
MTTLTSPRSHGAGFSLIELMVSVVIGLLALSFATRMIVASEQNKVTALGGSDAMQNGMLALFSINDDVTQAGYGLNDTILNGCDTVFSDTSGYTLAPAQRGGVAITPLASAVIESNGANPDRISLYSGSALSGTGTVGITANYSAGSTISIDRVPYGFRLGDVIVAVPETPGTRCALAQIGVDPATLAPPPAAQTLSVVAGAGLRFNTGALGATFAAGQARIYNLGPATTLSFHTWSVAEGFLQLRSTNLAGASVAPATVIDNVVSIKAQYGFDTRVSAPGTTLTDAGTQIGKWSSTMIDADSDGVVGDPGDYQRITALRIAVVARSQAIERAPAAGCSTTTVLPQVVTAAQPTGVAAVPISVNVTVAGDPVDWKCYRYRVFETIVPLRNSGWSQL